MKKFFIIALALTFSVSANAKEITKAEVKKLPASEVEAADPFEFYPQAYQDNEYGKAAEKPEPTLVKPKTPVPSEVFGTDKRGNIIIK